MKKINRHVPDVPQGIADRGTELIERYFVAYGVKRAADLPEEGKVRLHRDLQSYFSEMMPAGIPAQSPIPWWTNMTQRVRRFFIGE